MPLLLVSFIAGFLTVLAPCSLFLLPSILLGSTSNKDPLRPWLVTGSLGLSVFAFTLLIKGTSLAFSISDAAWGIFSGLLLALCGLSLFFPHAWDVLASKLNLSKSQALLNKSNQQGGKLGAVLVGASLGPVFSTCSPTFAILLATVLPGSFFTGAVHIAFFVIGMMIPFLIIGLGGQRILSRFRFFANPDGSFKKILGVLLVLLGLMVATGFQKTVEEWIVRHGYFGPIQLEQSLLE